MNQITEGSFVVFKPVNEPLWQGKVTEVYPDDTLDIKVTEDGKSFKYFHVNSSQVTEILKLAEPQPADQEKKPSKGRRGALESSLAIWEERLANLMPDDDTPQAIARYNKLKAKYTANVNARKEALANLDK